jgi:hypothetical protein
VTVGVIEGGKVRDAVYVMVGVPGRYRAAWS